MKRRKVAPKPQRSGPGVIPWAAFAMAQQKRKEMEEKEAYARAHDGRQRARHKLAK